MTAPSTTPVAPPAGDDRPDEPPPSTFAISMGIAFVVMTVVSVLAANFSLAGVLEDLTRRNNSITGLLNLDLAVMFSERSRSAFIETLQMAVVGTVVGGFLSLPLALWSTEVGAPRRWVMWIVRPYNNVVRAIPDILWALLFVAMVGIGVLPGLLALVFFSMAVTTKLTSDVLDGIDLGPVEAADASGAGHTQMLRTAIVPQVLPAYSSFLLYNFELNLRASAVLGLVGAGGIGTRIEFYRSGGDWEQVWGLIVMFFIVTFLVERLSLTFRRRLV